MPSIPTTVATTLPTGVQGVTLQLTEKGDRFIPASLTAAAGANITLVIDDQDLDSHNFALYRDASYSTALFRSPVVTGPVTLTYTFPAPDNPGVYYFRSDPNSGMVGKLYVNSRVLIGY
jgi:plastocyanin